MFKARDERGKGRAQEQNVVNTRTVGKTLHRVSNETRVKCSSNKTHS